VAVPSLTPIPSEAVCLRDARSSEKLVPISAIYIVQILLWYHISLAIEKSFVDILLGVPYLLLAAMPLGVEYHTAY